MTKDDIKALQSAHDVLYNCRAMLPESDGCHAEIGAAMQGLRRILADRAERAAPDLSSLDSVPSGGIRLDDPAGVAPSYVYWGPLHKHKTASAAITEISSRSGEYCPP